MSSGISRTVASLLDVLRRQTGIPGRGSPDSNIALEEAMSSDIPGQEVADSTEFDQIEKWLRLCGNHPLCNDTRAIVANSVLHTRLIDVFPPVKMNELLCSSIRR
jgi:hypothetical protein